MCEGKGYIFISYAHKDSDVVLPLIEGLINRGFRVWYDSGIEAGTEWPEYIAEKLIGCSVVIAFISQYAVESKNCRREINFSIDENKEMLAVYLKEDLELSPGMRLQLKTLQGMFRDRFDNDEDFLDKLAEAEFLRCCKNEDNVKNIEEYGDKTEGVLQTGVGKVITGKKINPDGSVYEGELIDDIPDGRGKITFVNGDVYVGTFVGGKAVGKGKAFFKNGDVYEGSFINGKISGKGKYKHITGEVYEGEYVAGKRNGKGKMIFADGHVYEGDFVSDKRTGKGKMVYIDGYVYEGDFLEGKRHGKGLMICDNGNIYEGDFENGKYKGEGKMIFTNGDVYEGGFVNDMRNGKGRYIFAGGEIREGKWEDDILKSGYKYDKNGKKIARIIDDEEKKLGLFGL